MAKASKTKTEPGWELYRTFLEVVRDGSLSGAARKLDLTITVGRHIDALEASLHVSLFSRSPQGLKAMWAALELVSHAEAMGGRVGGVATHGVRRGDRRSRHGSPHRQQNGRMRGVAADAGALPRRPSRHHAGACAEQPQPICCGRADIAVRMVRPRQKSLVARRIGKSRSARKFCHIPVMSRDTACRRLSQTWKSIA